ncbi:MAG: RNase H family protein, partial [Pseudomonadota bacterium]
SSEGASHWHLPLGVGGRGIALGNPERWSGLRLNIADHDVDWRWVKGHAGVPGNERADQLAREAIDSL